LPSRFLFIYLFFVLFGANWVVQNRIDHLFQSSLWSWMIWCWFHLHHTVIGLFIYSLSSFCSFIYLFKNESKWHWIPLLDIEFIRVAEKKRKK